MKFCTECGNELRDDAVLCPHCGFTVVGEKTQQKKFCSACGKEVTNETFCPQCGNSLKGEGRWLVNPKYRHYMQIFIKIFMLLACVRAVFFATILMLEAFSIPNLEDAFKVVLKIIDLYDVAEIINFLGINYQWIFSTAAVGYAISLFWLIPMTVHYFKSIAGQKQIGLCFKICTIIFVSPIAGVLMIINDCKINQ